MNRYAPKITKEEVNALAQETFAGEIVVVSDEAALAVCLAALAREPLVGIDTETRPVFVKGSQPSKVALLQISTEKTAYLLRLNKMGFPVALADFLENEKVRKIGISLKDDFHALRRWPNFTQVSAFVDLQSVVRQFGIEEMSLQKIYAIVEGKKISKRQRLSNWESPELTPKQQQYAALDAWACLRLYRTLLGNS